MCNTTVTLLENGNYQVVVANDEGGAFEGTFYDALTEYMHECEIVDRNFEAKGSFRCYAFCGQLAFYEQVIVALWPTVPRHLPAYNLSNRDIRDYKNALTDLSLVIDYFKNGDLVFFWDSIDSNGRDRHTDPQEIIRDVLDVDLFSQIFDSNITVSRVRDMDDDEDEDICYYEELDESEWEELEDMSEQVDHVESHAQR